MHINAMSDVCLILPHPQNNISHSSLPRSSKFGKNIDQRERDGAVFNTENAIFENFPPEVMNFAEMKAFS